MGTILEWTTSDTLHVPYLIRVFGKSYWKNSVHTVSVVHSHPRNLKRRVCSPDCDILRYHKTNCVELHYTSES